MKWNKVEVKRTLLLILWGAVIGVVDAVAIVKSIEGEMDMASTIVVLFILQMILILGTMGIYHTGVSEYLEGEGDGTE